MGQPELIKNPRYATNAVRMQHNDELQALVTGWVAERPRDEILKILDEHEVVCSQVNDSSDIVQDEHYLERTLVELTGVEALGKVLMPGPVVHLHEYAGPTYDGVPRIGEHSDEVLRELLGLDDDELAGLRHAGVVGGS
jgi:crotonobetainyl-CoA:carnitine CoA-transferase CaiB-like acyl-CoA transferase